MAFEGLLLGARQARGMAKSSPAAFLCFLLCGCIALLPGTHGVRVITGVQFAAKAADGSRELQNVTQLGNFSKQGVPATSKLEAVASESQLQAVASESVNQTAASEAKVETGAVTAEAAAGSESTKETAESELNMETGAVRAETAADSTSTTQTGRSESLMEKGAVKTETAAASESTMQTAAERADAAAGEFSAKASSVLESAKHSMASVRQGGRNMLQSVLQTHEATRSKNDGPGLSDKLFWSAVILTLSALIIKCVNYIKVDVGEDLKDEADPDKAEAEDASGTAFSPAPQHDGPVLIFLAVGRVKDKTVLATHSPLEDKTKAQEAEKIMRKLLVKAQTGHMPKGERDFMVWEDGKIGWVLDPQGEYMACLATITKTYPKPAAFALLTEFSKAASATEEAKTAGKHKLTAAMLPRMQELLAKYETPGTSSAYGQTLNKMQGIKNTMHQNIAQAQETADSMSALKKSTANMESFAKAFNKTAETAKWKYLLDRYKMNITAGVIVIDFISLYYLWKIA